MRRGSAIIKVGSAPMALRTPARNLGTLSRAATMTASRPGSPKLSAPHRQQHLSASGPSGAATHTIRPGAIPTRRHYGSATPTGAPLRKTPLHALHESHGGKMVAFAGFAMPVQYAGHGLAASHAHTRAAVSLFDVGHMVQRVLRGPGAAAFLERVTPADAGGLGAHASVLSALLRPGTGGIVDDLIVSRLGDEEFYVVTNAGCRDKDDAFLAEELARWNAEGAGGAVEHVELEGWGLVALQGPRAAEALGEVLAPDAAADLPKLLFGNSRYLTLRVGGSGGGAESSPLLVSRAGYTGEDGFEISIPPEETVAVTEALLSAGSGSGSGSREEGGGPLVRLAGLGARDSLRLEAGMCLYGHDLDEGTTPVEAALGWIIPKSRRAGGRASFYGADTILPQLTPRSKGGKGVERRRVGLVVEGAPAREGAEIVGPDGEALGKVTSGCPSPTLGKNIAMGYVRDGFHKVGTEVDVLVRGKRRKATVTKMPFVPTRYWKGAAPA